MLWTNICKSAGIRRSGNSVINTVYHLPFTVATAGARWEARRRCIDALGITGARWEARRGIIKPMTDAPTPPGAPTDAPHHTLTVDEAAARYEQAGISRTIRRIQKYCARGDLDCKKVETEFGEKYLITIESIDRHIAQISDALAAAGRAPTRPGAPERPLEQRPILTETEAAPPSAQARPDAAGRDYQALYIQQLENENAFLREQTVVLLDRVKETNVLTQGLQRLLAPLLRAPRSGAGEGTDKNMNDDESMTSL